MRRVLVVKTGRTLPSLLARRGDSDAWIAAAMGVDLASLDVVPVFEGAPLPMALEARTVNEYDVPLTRPVTVQPRPAALHVAPPGLAVAV